MQRDVWARPRIRRRREIIGVRFAGDLEDGNSDFLCQLRTVQEPFGVSPGLHNLFSMLVTRFSFLFHVVEVIKHQQGMGERFRGNRRQFRVVQRIDQRMDIVTALHGAQQFNGFFRGNQGGGRFAFGDRGKESSFNIGGFVDARRYTVNQQV
ncbi:Uncharacterised protein [Klebsiella pneumoniae]|nr:Uncharacterised protein [Klebsiella pneumoniae]